MILEIEQGEKIEVSFHHTQKEVEFRPGLFRKMTECVINTPYNPPQHGVSVCHPPDQFCKATGRKIALSRAMESFHTEFRAKIWKAYFKAINANFAAE